MTSARYDHEHYVRIGTKGGKAEKHRRHHSPVTESPAPEPPAEAS